MIKRLALTVLAIGGWVGASAGEEIDLFNGKDLSGWTYFLADKNLKMEDVWSVQDGVIICKGKPAGYIKTEGEYENFVLTFDWRWKPESKGGNSGAFVFVVGEDKIWPKAVEAQLQAGAAGDFWLVDGAKLEIDEKRHAIDSPRHYFRMRDAGKVEKPIGEWNHYEIQCKDGEVTLTINGKLVNVGKNADPRKGKILLQSEGAEIHFRNIKLKTLE